MGQVPMPRWFEAAKSMNIYGLDFKVEINAQNYRARARQLVEAVEKEIQDLDLEPNEYRVVVTPIREFKVDDKKSEDT